MNSVPPVGKEKLSLAILMPGYNVASTIEQALCSLSQQTLDAVAEIVFINNASKDATLAKVRAIQEENKSVGTKLTVINNYHNYGLGGSLKIGIWHILNCGHDALMILHSDGQGDNESIADSFLQRARQEQAWDLILANRFVQGADLRGYDRKRILGNLFFNILTHVLVGVRMSDAGTGIILVKTHLLRQIAFANLTSELQFNPMLNILMYKTPGIRIAEMPLHWHDSEIESAVVPWHYVLNLTKILLLYRMRRILGLPGFSDAPHKTDWIQDYPHELLLPVHKTAHSPL